MQQENMTKDNEVKVMIKDKTKKLPELKPCHNNCEVHDLQLFVTKTKEYHQTADGYYVKEWEAYVYCWECGNGTPLYDSAEGAIEAWNASTRI